MTVKPLQRRIVRGAIGVLVGVLTLSITPAARAQYTGDFQTNIISGVVSNWAGEYYVHSAGVLLIQNSGVLSVHYADVGFDSSSNSAVVSGSGSVWSSSGYLNIGSGIGAQYNSLTITNGGVVSNLGGKVGYGQLTNSSLSNSVLVTGAGSVWSNGDVLYIGWWSTGNSLKIADGGAVYDTDAYVGTGNCTNNTVTVSGNGALWQNQGNLYVGDAGVSDQLTIGTGGSVLASNVYVGLNYPSSMGSQVTISGGSLYVTNASHNAVLEITSGQVTLNAGVLQVDILVVTNANGHFVHNGGTLIAGAVLLDPNLDADGDGLPNGWEQAYGFDPLDTNGINGATSDPDGDGFTNLQEFYGGSDPTNNASVPFRNWWNTSASGKWEVGSSWILGVAPDSHEAIFLTNAPTKIVTIDATTTNSPGAMTISNLVVSGPANVTNTLKLANAGTNTPLVVRNGFVLGSGGVLLVTNAALCVGSNLTISGVGVTLPTNGVIMVTNAAHNAVLDVQCGTVTFSGGTLQADILIITNACGRFIHTGGTLIYGQLVLGSSLSAVGDGIRNGWKQQYGLDPFDPNLANEDPDGDGYNNWEEYQASTDPTNTNSKPFIPPPPNMQFYIYSVKREGNDIRLTWTAMGGTTNVVQAGNGIFRGAYSNNFANISQSMIVTGSGPSSASYLDVGGATNRPSRFYRVRLVP